MQLVVCSDFVTHVWHFAGTAIKVFTAESVRFAAAGAMTFRMREITQVTTATILRCVAITEHPLAFKGSGDAAIV